MIATNGHLVIDGNLTGRDEPRGPMNDRDVISRVKPASHRLLAIDDRLRAPPQFAQRGDFQARLSNEWVTQGIGDLGNGKPQRLAGNGVPVRAPATDFAVPFHQDHITPRFGQLHGGTLTAGSGTYDDNIRLAMRHGSCFPETFELMAFLRDLNSYVISNRTERQGQGRA